MNIKNWILENYPDEKILLSDGFDRAFVGIGRIFSGPSVAVYDKSMVITILRESGMKPDEAYEYFDFNVAGAYVGEKTPMFVETKRSLRKEKK
ncbi:MAG: hypothetical protein EBR82_88300 [Caulobacteraceae bacterium]|nr:hypothetical protein [Caulobacteraceae bacterium]